MKKQQGFTLIELLVAMAVMIVLVTVAVPSFSQYIANQRAKAASQNLFMAFNYARSEAIKRNGQVRVEPLGASWQDGWRIVAGGDQLRIQPPESLARVTISGGGSAVVFSGNGRVGSSLQLTACDDANRAQRRIVELDPSGRPNLSLGGACT